MNRINRTIDICLGHASDFNGHGGEFRRILYGNLEVTNSRTVDGPKVIGGEGECRNHRGRSTIGGTCFWDEGRWGGWIPWKVYIPIGVQSHDVLDRKGGVHGWV